MLRSVICEGDPTTHGGKVMEGYGPATVDGRKVARRGHLTFCPKCKGQFAIIEGLDHHTFAGIGTALEGMKTACGAELIATQHRMKVDDGKGGGAATQQRMKTDDDASSEAAPAAPVAKSDGGPADSAQASFSGSFRAVDKGTGSPLPDIPYRIELEDGSTIRGKTDSKGNTQIVTSKSAESVRLYWEVEAEEPATGLRQ